MWIIQLQTHQEHLQLPQGWDIFCSFLPRMGGICCFLHAIKTNPHLYPSVGARGLLWLVHRHAWLLHGCDSSSRAISDCRGPCQLGKSSPTFTGVDVHYLRFTSVIPFHDMASGEIVGNDLWWVVTTLQEVKILRKAWPLLQPVTDWVYWTWVTFPG